MTRGKLFWRTNESIRASEVRVIGADGKQLGVMPVSKALEESKTAKLDLVEIAPTAKPPVVKIVDFGKFRYREEKKFRAQLKKSKPSELKEVRFSPFISEHDYSVKLERVKEFLVKRDKVRLVVVFRGPQMRSKQFGFDLLKKLTVDAGEVAVDMKPKFLGKHLIMIISPIAGAKPARVSDSIDIDEKK